MRAAAASLRSAMGRRVVALGLGVLGAACTTPPSPSGGASSSDVAAVRDDVGVTSIASTSSVASASSSTTSPRPRPKGAPLVRPVRWLCDEQGCEGSPVYAYDYLPAVSEDDRFVAYVEERDGWGHTPKAGVRVVAVATEASVEFFPVEVGAADMTSAATVMRRKHEFQALVDAANAGLAPYRFRPLFPSTSTSPCAPPTPGAPQCDRLVAPELTIDVVSKGDGEAAYAGIAKVVVRQGGKEVARVNATAWDPGNGCSTRGFALLGARADAHVAVFLTKIVMTGHNCDGVPENQPWPVKIITW